MNIRNVKFFEGIDPTVVEEISSVCKSRSYAAKDVIFEKGAAAGHLYILKSGSVELLLRKTDNIVYGLETPGEIFGWSSIVENGVYTSTATCVTETDVLSISKNDIEGIFNRHTDAAVTFYRRLGSIVSKRITRAVE
ncbi:MAG: cyclic nucleotide-binding domain-containing protein [Desulfobacterales bacterium]|nr:cyclic nucleotide-binding domain-containing protein [Desulfobacterales bacterium]